MTCSHLVAVLKNGTLYIDGGRQTFIDVSGAGNEPQQIGVPTYGYSEQLDSQCTFDGDLLKMQTNI